MSCAYSLQAVDKAIHNKWSVEKRNHSFFWLRLMTLLLKLSRPGPSQEGEKEKGWNQRNIEEGALSETDVCILSGLDKICM